MKNKFILLACLMPLWVNAAGVRQVGPNLYVPDYSQQEMASAGCAPDNWNRLVNQYVQKRSQERLVEQQFVDQYVRQAPSASLNGSGSCIESAMNSVNSAISSANRALSILNGNFDFNSLANTIGNQLMSAACRQIDYTVNQAISGVTGQVSNTLNGATGAVTNYSVNTGTPAGSVNVGNQVYNGSQNTNTIPYVNSGTVNNAVGNTSQSIFSKLNPFSNSGGVQNIPDTLK